MALTRRLLAGMLALVLGGLVVAGSPVGAANTASEGLFDHDDDVGTPEVRRFAGINRYVTSVALAEAFFENASVGELTDTLIVASGESVVDASTASGLAAVAEAAVVFTSPGGTSRRLRDFIDDRFVSEVIIVGGVDVVSESVAVELAGLPTVSSVRRLAGADRYETAVLVAREMGVVGDYCDTSLVTAVLANADSALADVISVGPLAYAAFMPVLLTGADELPAGVAGYLADAGIEQVLVVGTTTSVSEAVVDELAASAIGVRRISGENQFETAVAVAKEIDACVGVELSSSSVALVNAEFAADGVAAGPVLGAGLGGDSAVTPVLLVSSSDVLPAATQEYLRSTPIRESSDGTYIDLAVTAIGGTEAVSVELMQAAIDAATTSAPLYVRTVEYFGVNDGSSFDENRVVVDFSDSVNIESSSTSADWATSALNPKHYLINNLPLLPTDIVRNEAQGSLGEVNGSIIGLILTAPDVLNEGDVITVLGGGISSSNGDNRRAKEYTYVHNTEYQSDKVRPRVTIEAPVGWHEFRLLVAEENMVRGAIGNFRLTHLTLNSQPLPAMAEVEDGSTGNSIVICLFGDGDPTDNDGIADSCSTTVPVGESLLAEGDVVRLAADAIVDRNNNSSRTTTVRVAAASGVPKLIRAAVSDVEVYRRLLASYDVEQVRTFTGSSAAYWWLYFLPTPNFVWLSNQRSPWEARNPACDLSQFTTRFLITGRREIPDNVHWSEWEDAEIAGAKANQYQVVWKQVNDPETAQNDAPNVKITVSKSRELLVIEFDEDSKVLDVVQAMKASRDFLDTFVIVSDAESDPDNPLTNLPLDGTLERTSKVPEYCEWGEPGLGPGYGESGIVAAGDFGATIFDIKGFYRGQSSVNVTLTFNQPVKSFDFIGLIDANAPGGYLGEFDAASLAFFQGSTECPADENFPNGYLGQLGHNTFNAERRWWEDPTISDLTRTYTFELGSDCFDLPEPGDAITIPAGFATGYNDETSEATTRPLRRTTRLRR